MFYNREAKMVRNIKAIEPYSLETDVSSDEEKNTLSDLFSRFYKQKLFPKAFFTPDSQ